MVVLILIASGCVCLLERDGKEKMGKEKDKMRKLPPWEIFMPQSFLRFPFLWDFGLVHTGLRVFQAGSRVLTVCIDCAGSSTFRTMPPDGTK